MSAPNPTGPLEIRTIKEAGADDLPIYDQVSRVHRIDRIEFDWMGKTYVVTREDAGPRGTMMRQSRRDDEPGITRLEIVARQRRPVGQDRAALEHFLFKTSDLMKIHADEAGSRWRAVQLERYEVVEH